jgi:hypothetical protein
MPESRSRVDPNYERQLKTLQAQAAAEADARSNGNQARWMRPDLQGWSGSLDDWEGMSKPFDRTDANASAVEAMADATNPGTSGDVVAGTVMAHYLGTMERSFRARHHLRRPRATAHLVGRKRGHGDNQGTLVQSGLEYVRGLVARAKGG